MPANESLPNPRKRFGQNFLTDNNIIQNIVRAIAPKQTDKLIEIGPGRGALTNVLVEHCDNLSVVEIDRDLVKFLQTQEQLKNITIIEADALKLDLSGLAENRPLRIVGNLPYNISTPLLFHLIQYRDRITDMHFMLQKEVVDRLQAKHGDKQYGRLSVMMQYFAQVDALFDVPPTCFYPPPKVNSAIVRLAPYKELPVTAKDESHFRQLVAICFQQRRKTLRNSLRKFNEDDIIDNLAIDTKRRPEELSVAEFVDLSNQLVTTS